MKDDGNTRKTHGSERVRIDKWLWAARFFKTRSLACDDIGKGRISVNGQAVKASREVHVGDQIELRHAALVRSVVVKGLSAVRGPAPVAQALYEETAASVARCEHAAEQRRQGTEPSHSLEQGRPTKRDRRQLADWNRWSASAEPE